MRKNPLLVANIFLWSRGKILLLKRSPKHTFGNRSPWNCPGGSIEFGETPREAIIREVQEETGITPDVHRLIALWSETFPTGVQIIVYSYFGTTESRDVRINHESIDSQWFSVSQAMKVETFPNFNDGLLSSLQYYRALERKGVSV